MTIPEIARLANVSTATVWRVLNRPDRVSSVLARRVRKVIEKDGYYVNTHARTLVSGRSRIFGLVVSEITNPFFLEMIQTFAKLGVSHNYAILLSSVGRDPSLLEATARQMIEHRVDGVAILTFGGEDALINTLTSRNVAVFAVDTDSPGPLLRTVRIDYQHGIRQAVQHLAALGHVRIAFVGGPLCLKTAVMRQDGFQQCMKEIDLEVLPEMVVEGHQTIEGGMEAISALVSLPDRPTAVVCSNDLIAAGLMRAASDLSLSIPRDLPVVGIDDIHLAQFMIPPLTTVEMSKIEIAALAFSSLLDSVEPGRDENAREVHSVKTNLVLRRSTTLAPLGATVAASPA
jgi:LacI family transcriptional regulator